MPMGVAPSPSRFACGDAAAAAGGAQAQASACQQAVADRETQLKEMAEALRLGGEVAVVDAVRRECMRHALHDLDAAGCQRGDLVRVVGQQPDSLDAEGAQHGGGDVEIPLVGLPAQRPVGVHRVQPAILQRIGAQLVDQADAPPFLAEIQHRAGALGGHAGDGALQLRPAIAAQAAEQVAGEAFGMHPHQRGGLRRRVADQDRQMLDALVQRAEGDQPRIRARHPAAPRLRRPW